MPLFGTLLQVIAIIYYFAIMEHKSDLDSYDEDIYVEESQSDTAVRSRIIDSDSHFCWHTNSTMDRSEKFQVYVSTQNT
jgi:hypothetical protein